MVDNPEELMVVGVGSSAGGITALHALFAAIPATRNLAFVVVQHMLPDQPSQLVRLFGGWTPMPVREATHGVALEPGCVYIAPPGQAVALERDVFTTRPLDGSASLTGIDSIDTFFESLAQNFGARAIGVVLSGAGADGAAGAVRIKQAGGIVLVQDPTTAMHDGMPNAAIANGAADHIMPLGPLAQELVACASPDYVRSSSATTWADEVTKALDGMIALIRARGGFDLTGYKTTPLLWRIQRRMQLRRVPLFRDYEALLHDDPTELETLIRGMPIHVTQFFRDPHIWQHLEREVIPELFGGSAPVRAWTPACATGEEAYSLAMLFAEQARGDFQVFATDASADVVARASRGIFKGAAVNALAAERRQRFFYAADGAFRVKRTLREKMVFAPQDLLADPPFTGLDLVTCRNLLIYLEPDAAKRVIYLLHASLRTGGYLVLGKSESIVDCGFEEVAAKSRIYRKTGRAPEGDFAFPKRPTRQSNRTAIDALSHEAALEQHELPGILVDDHFQIVRVYGDTSGYLRLTAGEPSLDALQLLPSSLATQLQRAAQEAKHRQHAITAGDATISMRVTPMQEERLLVSFLSRNVEEVRTPDEMDWSEALRVSHEELESSREELQALNEELRASNDQLNISNDELNTANARLRDKLDELETQSHVLSSGGVTTLFLDEDLRLRFFTPAVSELFPVRAGDIGRRITDLVPKFDHPAFLDHVHAVMQTGVPCEAEVRTFDGRWYVQRIKPFRRMNAGVAITFNDITELKTIEEALRATNEHVDKLVSLMPAGVYTCDAEGVITYYNARAVEIWGREPGEQKFCGALRMWTIDGTLVRDEDCPMVDAVRHGRAARNLEVVIEQPSGTRIVANVNIDPLYDRDGKLAGAINVFVDVTDRKRAEEAVRRSEAALTTELEAIKRLHVFSTAANDARDATELIELALDALIHLHGADMGSVQLYDPSAAVLRIASHRNFEPWLVEHFAEVDASEHSACAHAMATRHRAGFEDVERESTDAADREVARRAGYRAVQATPLLTAGGGPLGMISTHFRKPRKLTDAECRQTDILANELASALDRINADKTLRDSERWLAAQNEAFQSAMNGAPLATSLGILIRAAIEQSETERRCAFYIANDAGTELHHVVGDCPPPDTVLDERGWSFPVATSAGKLVGSFAIYSVEPRTPTGRDRELAKTLTQTAAIIISRHLEAT